MPLPTGNYTEDITGSAATKIVLFHKCKKCSSEEEIPLKLWESGKPLKASQMKSAASIAFHPKFIFMPCCH